MNVTDKTARVWVRSARKFSRQMAGEWGGQQYGWLRAGLPVQGWKSDG